VFGFSLSELVVVIIVALVVIGPKDLPKMLRKLGQWAGKLRRMASELRAQSGIDDALRSEGLADDIAEIRKLARGELDDVRRAATIDPVALAGAAAQPSNVPSYRDDFYIVREREYPRDGADAYGALPDNAIVYAEGLPKSALGRDPLYVVGDANAELPPEAPRKPPWEDDGAAAEEAAPANGEAPAPPVAHAERGEASAASGARGAGSR
jgi:sec-independent protein translocase protein TatB